MRRTITVLLTAAAATALTGMSIQPAAAAPDPSSSELASTKSQLTKSAPVGTTRYVDPARKVVVVTYDDTVKGKKLARLRSEVNRQDGKAVLKHTPGKLRTYIAGGDAIWAVGASGRCSLGFNVTDKDGDPAFLTAGHCIALGADTWSDTQGGEAIGTATDYGFIPADDAIVKYSRDVPHPSEVNLYNGSTQKITNARDAVVGDEVQRSGSTTQLHGGTVNAVDVSATFPQGTVDHLIDTDVCAEPGDSGGAMFSGEDALGTTTGGSGDCTFGGRTLFYPVTIALSDFNATIGSGS